MDVMKKKELAEERKKKKKKGCINEKTDYIMNTEKK